MSKYFLGDSRILAETGMIVAHTGRMGMQGALSNSAMVGGCSVRGCIYSSEFGCMAKRVKINHGIMTKCETFMPSIVTMDIRIQCTHVASCEVTACKYNNQTQCMAEQIRIGHMNGQPGCVDFVRR